MSDYGSQLSVRMGARTYQDLREAIFEDCIAPNFREEIIDLLDARHRWKKIANYTEGFAHVFLSASILLGLAAGYFDNRYVGLSATGSSSACMALLRYSSYADKESEERNSILSRQLSYLGITPLPSLSTETEPPGDGREAATAPHPAEGLHSTVPHAAVPHVTAPHVMTAPHAVTGPHSAAAPYMTEEHAVRPPGLDQKRAPRPQLTRPLGRPQPNN